MTRSGTPEGSARGWSAEDRVPPLDFNLAPYGSAGTIREPSRAQVPRFLASLRRAAQHAGVDPARVAGASVARLADELSALPPERLEEIAPDLLDACGEICGADLPRGELDRLSVPLQLAIAQSPGRQTQLCAQLDARLRAHAKAWKAHRRSMRRFARQAGRRLATTDRG